MKDSLLDNVGDLLVGDGSLLVELVVGTTVLDGLEERLLGRHDWRCSGEK